MKKIVISSLVASLLVGSALANHTSVENDNYSNNTEYLDGLETSGSKKYDTLIDNNTSSYVAYRTTDEDGNAGKSGILVANPYSKDNEERLSVYEKEDGTTDVKMYLRFDYGSTKDEAVKKLKSGGTRYMNIYTPTHLSSFDEQTIYLYFKTSADDNPVPYTE